MKIMTIIGARPQFIKAAPVSFAIRKAGLSEFILHTGQHYDKMMSDVFFTEMGIPKPDLNIDVGSGSHGYQTGQMLMSIEQTLIDISPDKVLVYGDTNSTLAGTLAARKLQIPLAHIEAGLRSFNRTMPEETNRVVADHCADILFCPTQTAVDNLKTEGITESVHLVGDTMVDALMQFIKIAERKSSVLNELDLVADDYYLATVHRPYNTDDSGKLADIVAALSSLDKRVIFPVHPRTKKKLADLSGKAPPEFSNNLKLIEPLGYLDMLHLEKNARMILTDSGGIQKEAYILSVPCITLRPETEWVETLSAGWNTLVGADINKIVSATQLSIPSESPDPVFGKGNAAKNIVEIISK
jgi:UDP-N-acetylglucosamine 2-epimerase